LKNWNDAARAYFRVLDLKPKQANTHYNLGCIFLELDCWDAANLAFQTAARLNAVGDFVALFRALALAKRKQLGSASEIMRDLQSTYPKSGMIAMVLGELELRSTHNEAALDFLREAQRFDPGLAGSYYKAGVALRKMGLEWDALGELQEALRRDSNHLPAQLELNELYASLGALALLDAQPPIAANLTTRGLPTA
jgi:tetratricopeptide (TPR) repeat protein